MTDTRELAAGDNVYSEDGHQAEFIARSESECIVRPLYEDEDGFTRTGDIKTWTHVFRTPPSPKLDAETAAAEGKLRALRSEIEQQRQVLRQEEGDIKTRRDRLKVHENLADLDDWLAGKITHYVAKYQYTDDIQILTVDETRESYPSPYSLGMLTLYPCKGWQGVTWSLNHKRGRDDYCHEYPVQLCRSLEEAQEKAKAIVAKQIAEFMAKPPEKREMHRAESLVARCQKFGVDAPADLIADIAERNRKALQQELDKAEAAAQLVRDRLATA